MHSLKQEFAGQCDEIFCIFYRYLPANKLVTSNVQDANAVKVPVREELTQSTQDPAMPEVYLLTCRQASRRILEVLSLGLGPQAMARPQMQHRALPMVIHRCQPRPPLQPCPRAVQASEWTTMRLAIA